MSGAPLVLALVAICLAAGSGLPSLALRRAPAVGGRIALVLVVLASLLGTSAAVLGLLRPGEAEGVAVGLPSPSLPLAEPGAALVGLDPLSSFFLVPVFLVGGLGAVYASGYRPAQRHPRTARRAALFWGLLVAGLALLVVARQALSFLVGWEAMALSAFFLITLDDEVEEARRAGFIYIVAAHVGTLVLFALFALWHGQTGTFAFVAPPPGSLGAGAANLLFLLALLAFGLKAGMMPLHFWLPGAHASAPSHVSAMLSGIVLKMGIYGLMRFTLLLPEPPAIQGEALLVLGAVSSLLGVVFAIAQHDLKRLLAYHSVENIGIIVMGLGLALLGRSRHEPVWIALGLGASLLHVWNHGLFKSLLFLGAGSVVERCGTRVIDRLGGLAKALPWTAAFFLIGAVAISGLPPLNGFASEFLVYLGSFEAVVSPGGGGGMALLVVPVLAATGALALACFVKVYGAVFLGQPRAVREREAQESPPSMLVPMAILAGLCLLIGLAPGLAGGLLDPVISSWAGEGGGELRPVGELAPLGSLGNLSLALLGLLAAFAGAALLLSRRKAKARSVGTWDCGYASPGPSMQYSASSFARPLAGIFAWLLRPRIEAPRVEGPFPEPSSMSSHVDDATLDRMIIPASRSLERRFGWFRRFQQGLIQHYLLYVLITLLVMLLTIVPFREILAGVLER